MVRTEIATDSQTWVDADRADVDRADADRADVDRANVDRANVEMCDNYKAVFTSLLTSDSFRYRV